MSVSVPSMEQLLTAWLPHQRWFPGKGRDVEVTRSGGLRLLDSGGVVGVEVHLVTARYADGGTDTFQVPLTYRRDAAPELEHALVGVLEHPTLGRVAVHDAPHDPVFCQALLRLISEQGWVTGEDVTGGGPGGTGAGTDSPSTGTARGVLQPGVPPPDPAMTAKVLTGEQSNTSIVYGAGSGTDAGTAIILKVFRTLHPGDNPDVAVQSALAGAGCLRVPQPIGWVEAAWDDGSPEGRSEGSDVERAHGHLAFASEFLAGSQDAWRVACDAVERGQDWSEPAAELGRATAEVHATLAEVMPVVAADTGHLQSLADDLLVRLEWAVAAVPALRPHAEAARAALDAVRDLAEPPALQRVHGDYHLGQVLSHPERGWVLLDFEGEPLRPLSERVRPDLALRDVAGMLRSFDYAARHATVGLPDDAQGRRQVAEAQEWSDACRDAFCVGYADVTGSDPRDAVALLRALELDKALYEVVYEARNRPPWLPIPMHAVQRLLAAADPNPSGRNPVTEPHTTPSPPPGVVSSSGPQSSAPESSKSQSSEPQPQPVSNQDLERIVSGGSHDPHSVLGPHPHDGAVTLRVLRPMADSVTALLPDGPGVKLTHEHEGIWVGVLPVTQVPDYRLEVSYTGDDGPLTSTVDDPYRFLPTLGEIDQHLVREGRHENLWQVLGAQVRRYDGPMGAVVGTSFAVWAPNARAVRVVADFNHWVGQQHAMRTLGSSGVWELFVPDVGAGTRYKFEILGRDGHWRQKADPMAYGTEVPPSTASMVVESQYEWGDGEWMTARAARDPHSGPVSVYEVHLGSWRQGLGYRELAGELVDYVQDMGFTHVELLPVAEHPFGGSWGYQVTSYYAPTSRFGHPDDLRYLIDRLHQAGIGVIIDWVPAHFPKDSWALANFDGEPLYEHGDPRRGEQQDWGTLVFDYGRSEVRNFLVANALYWLEEFHTDGLRVDAVASMLYLDYSREAGGWAPNKYGGREHLEAIDFLQETNATAYKRVPGIMMIAEESTAWPGVTRPTHLGGLGFGLKWNMGWMHDSLGYAAEDPVHRQYHHHRMTFSMMYAFSENFVLPISHDEVVHGKGSLLRKMPGDRWQQLANLRAFLAYMWAHPGKQLLFMGSEFGQESEWAESRSLDWWLLDQPVHRGVQSLVRDLNQVYGATPALWERDADPSGFEWVDANDTVHNTFSFVRRDAGGNPLVCVVNFAGAPHEGYRIGMPAGGTWREVLNTDAELYGGSGVGNMGEVHAQEIPWHGMPASAVLRVPPLGALWLTPAR